MKRGKKTQLKRSRAAIERGVSFGNTVSNDKRQKTDAQEEERKLVSYVLPRFMSAMRLSESDMKGDMSPYWTERWKHICANYVVPDNTSPWRIVMMQWAAQLTVLPAARGRVQFSPFVPMLKEMFSAAVSLQRGARVSALFRDPHWTIGVNRRDERCGPTCVSTVMSFLSDQDCAVFSRVAKSMWFTGWQSGRLPVRHVNWSLFGRLCASPLTPYVMSVQAAAALHCFIAGVPPGACVTGADILSDTLLDTPHQTYTRRWASGKPFIPSESTTRKLMLTFDGPSEQAYWRLFVTCLDAVCGWNSHANRECPEHKAPVICYDVQYDDMCWMLACLTHNMQPAALLPAYDNSTKRIVNGFAFYKRACESPRMILDAAAALGLASLYMERRPDQYKTETGLMAYRPSKNITDDYVVYWSVTTPNGHNVRAALYVRKRVIVYQGSAAVSEMRKLPLFSALFDGDADRKHNTRKLHHTAWRAALDKLCGQTMTSAANAKEAGIEADQYATLC
jgi:hypothetical protein